MRREQNYGSYSRYGSDSEEIALDLTSLIDVIFILLVFLILTAGISHVYTQVDIPKSDTPPVASKKEELEILVEIPEISVWVIDKKRYTNRNDFREELLKLSRERKDSLLLIAPKRTLPVEELVKLLNFLAEKGISNLQIVSQWS